MPLFFFLFFLGITHIYSKGCLSISSNEPCLTCLSSYYENSYLTELKISAVIKKNLVDSNCILKENKKIIRIIHILNTQCIECSGADATYDNLPKAFEEESKLAIRLFKLKTKKIKLFLLYLLINSTFFLNIHIIAIFFFFVYIFNIIIERNILK